MDVLEHTAANDGGRISKTAEKYVMVNGTWPVASNLLPPLSARMAVKAFRVLYRYRFHKPWHLKVVPVKGRRRRTWTDANPKAPRIGSKEWKRWGLTAMLVAPDAGWHSFIHDLSHWMHGKQYPGQFAHKGSAHAAVERDLIEEVLRRGWLEDQPTVKTDDFVVSPEDKQADKAVKLRKELGKTEAGIKRWTTKAKRAQTALKKLQRRQANLKKRLA